MMASLIKLTVWDLNVEDEEKRIILVNPVHIVTVRNVYGKTEVVLDDGREIMVFENLELIYSKVQDATS